LKFKAFLKLLKNFFKNFQDFVFPNICIHCQNKTGKNHFFCDVCIDHFEFLNEEEKIFNFFKNQNFPIIHTFENIGPAKTLFREIRKKSPLLPLVKLASSFMVYKYLEKSKYPMPDVIIPISRDFKRVAKEISKILKKPCRSYFNKRNEKKILLVTDIIREEELEKFLEKSFLEKNFPEKSFPEIFILSLFF
jgi:hypothetical protein